MLTRPHPLACGDVVACGNNRGVVWQVRGPTIVVLPLVHSGDQRYRGDEPITEFRDMLQAGMGGTDLVIRVSRACVVGVDRQNRIGRLSDAIIARIQRACDRECTAVACEARWELV